MKLRKRTNWDFINKKMMKKLALITAILISAFLQQYGVYAQSVADAMKIEALREMKAGRYGEAIDVLNRYIAARPQQSDGYNLRGICNEKRQLFEFAVYDYRSARKIDPNNREINNNLERATNSWYSLIYNEIEGYKREIAINPKKPDNYLAIGKDYKNLGQWPVSEVWYDKYLALAHASPDEIIRYSEILAKNNHIAKGWPILKKYTEEYPTDQRLWSRFGYFSLWLGKTKIAISAFESALAIKPYFKEAMDGLDLAKGKGYVFTVNDTSAKHFNYGMPTPKAAFVYPIDKYYKIIKKNPSDSETRFKLLQALIEVKRFEEARQQVVALENAKYDTVEVMQISTRLDSISTSYYQNKINGMTAKFNPDSTDKNTALELGNYYCRMQDYDSALVAYTAYLNKNPDDEEVLFAYAQAQASNRDYNRALERMYVLLNKHPDNLKYKLFVGQLDVWLGQNLDTAKILLGDVLKQDPNNLGALIAYSSLNMRQNNFEVAKEYIEKVRVISPGSQDLKSLETTFETQKLRYQDEQNYAILQEGRRLWGDGQCSDAVAKFDEYMSKSEPNILIEKEYADVNVCAHNYQKAIDTYNNILSQGYDYNTDLSKAEAYYAMGDSVNALQAFQTLASSHPDDYTAKLYLGDSYLKMHEYKKAREVYQNMEDSLKLDSVQTASVRMRYNWIPVSGFTNFINTFPAYALLTPTASYYSDNIGIRNYIIGLRLYLGITSFFSLGVEGGRTALVYNSTRVISNMFKWDLTFRMDPRTIFALSFGDNYYFNYYTTTYIQPVAEILLRTEDPEHYMLYGDFVRMDASQVIYSSYLITNRLRADLTRAGGYYQLKSGLKITADGTYFDFSDGNTGYNFSFKIGKYFYPDFMLGYQYYNSGFRHTSTYYFSPTSYSTHNIFADWDIVKEDNIKFTIGGLIGFVSNSSYILRQGYATATWRPFDRLTLTGRIAGGSSFQNTEGYSSFSALFAAYWAL
ncbi:MAG: tetratricopeptide repeat protein [Ignavibacteriaceae bacterium]|nr:tetratricopeptide repeat protein [Ignavibacteriaceae bacterium]